MVVFVSQSKRAILRDSQLDEMGVKHGLKQNDKGNQNSLYSSLYTIVQTTFVPQKVVTTDYFQPAPFTPHFMIHGFSAFWGGGEYKSIVNAPLTIVLSFENRGRESQCDPNSRLCGGHNSSPS